MSETDPFLLTFFELIPALCHRQHGTHQGLKALSCPVWLSGPHTPNPPDSAECTGRVCTLDSCFSEPLYVVFIAVFLLHCLSGYRPTLEERQSSLIPLTQAGPSGSSLTFCWRAGGRVRATHQVVLSSNPASPLLAMQPVSPWHSPRKTGMVDLR